MALSKWLIATVMLGLSVPAASACDDYAEEMAMIAAKRAVAEARMAAEADRSKDVQAEQQTGVVVTAEQTKSVVTVTDTLRQ